MIGKIASYFTKGKHSNCKFKNYEFLAKLTQTFTLKTAKGMFCPFVSIKTTHLNLYFLIQNAWFSKKKKSIKNLKR